jgi:hypothetical protein
MILVHVVAVGGGGVSGVLLGRAGGREGGVVAINLNVENAAPLSLLEGGDEGGGGGGGGGGGRGKFGGGGFNGANNVAKHPQRFFSLGGKRFDDDDDDDLESDPTIIPLPPLLNLRHSGQGLPQLRFVHLEPKRQRNYLGTDRQQRNKNEMVVGKQNDGW